MDYKKIPVLIDTVFCVIFLPLIITLVPVDRWIVKYTSFAVLLIVFLYVLYFIYRSAKVTSLVMKGHYWPVVLVLMVSLTLASLLSHYPFPDDPSRTAVELARYKRLRVQSVWMLFLIVTGFSLSIELVFELTRQVIAKKDIEAEKNKAQLSLYKAQIDPHFLFNTLNVIYGMIVSKSEKTEGAFVKFTGILKYMHANSNRDFIPVEEEYEYIKQYVDLQNFRHNNHTNVRLDYSVDDGSIMFPPMILITFVENAFKYGASSNKDCEISIFLDIKDGLLHFGTKNKVMRKSHEGKKGIGIENCRRRLDLLYPGAYELKSEGVDTGDYIVDLKVDLKYE